MGWENMRLAVVRDPLEPLLGGVFVGTHYERDDVPVFLTDRDRIPAWPRCQHLRLLCTFLDTTETTNIEFALRQLSHSYLGGLGQSSVWPRSRSICMQAEETGQNLHHARPCGEDLLMRSLRCHSDTAFSMSAR